MIQKNDASPLSVVDMFSKGVSSPLEIEPSAFLNEMPLDIDLNNPVAHVSPIDDVDDITPEDDSLEDGSIVDAKNDDDLKDANTIEDPTVEPITPEESTQVELFFDAFTESLGWEETENKPKSIDELIGYIGNLVEEKSTPTYASDEVRELDTYIKNGGKLEDYFEIGSQIADYEKFDVEDEGSQKQILKDYLKLQGYSDQQITRKIERYEDTGMLADEAEDAVNYLKEVKVKEKQSMLEQQELARAQAEEEQNKFYSEVNTTIGSLKEIRGIDIPEADKKALKDYIFKVGADGTTQYQKDYSKNLTKNLLESAYFTMKGDVLLKSAQRKGETSAVNKLKQSLKSSPSRRSSHGMDNGSATPVWAAVSRALKGDAV